MRRWRGRDSEVIRSYRNTPVQSRLETVRLRVAMIGNGALAPLSILRDPAKLPVLFTKFMVTVSHFMGAVQHCYRNSVILQRSALSLEGKHLSFRSFSTLTRLKLKKSLLADRIGY